MAALRNTDARIAEDRPVTPAFLFAALLWPVLRVNLAGYEVQDMPPAMAIEHTGGQLFADQVHRVAVPKRFSLMSREIWALQHQLENPRGKRPAKLMDHPRLRAAYDFLLLRAEAGEPLQEQVDWWTQRVEAQERKGGGERGGERRGRGERRNGGGRARPPRNEAEPGNGRDAPQADAGDGNVQPPRAPSDAPEAAVAGTGDAPQSAPRKRRRRRRRRKPAAELQGAAS